VRDVHRDSKSQEQQQQAHLGVRNKRKEASSFSLPLLLRSLPSLVLVDDGVALVASRRVVVVGGGCC